MLLTAVQLRVIGSCQSDKGKERHKHLIVVNCKLINVVVSYFNYFLNLTSSFIMKLKL